MSAAGLSALPPIADHGCPLSPPLLSWPSPQSAPSGRGGKGRVCPLMGKPHATATAWVGRGVLARLRAYSGAGNAR